MTQAAANALAVDTGDNLLVRARDGDRWAFGELVRMRQRSVFSLALRMLSHRESAEDLAQDVFLELHRSLDAIESPDHLTFWLRRVTTHRAIDRVRRRANVELIDLDAGLDLSSETPTEDPLWQRHIQQLLSGLAPDARAVVLLRYQEDQDPTEIARLLDMPINTVKSHLKRSLATLRRRALGDEGVVDGTSEVERHE
jgi:RNA polymerase sigma-70 factor, ECF subfamily